jgi:hypothetical protein
MLVAVEVQMAALCGVKPKAALGKLVTVTVGDVVI